MTAIDFFIVLILLGVVALEAKRGFGRALLDFFAVLVASRVATSLLPTLSNSIKLVAETHANEARVYAVSFIIIGAILLLISKLIYAVTLISADTFDLPLGAIFGIGVGITLCHVLVRTISLTAGPDIIPPIIASSTFGREFLTFDTYHTVLDSLHNYDSPDRM